MAGLSSKNSLTVEQLAEFLEATVVGPQQRSVDGVNFIERATATELAFVGGRKNIGRLRTAVSQVIIAPTEVADLLSAFPEITFLLVADAEVAFLKAAERLVPHRRVRRVGISPRAMVADTAIIGAHTNVHAFAVIGDDVRIGENCNIGEGTVIGDGCVIGDNVNIDAHCVLYADVHVGSDVRIQAGTVLGAEGFGYRTVNGRHEALPHVGTVEICDDVQIGAACTVDRAKMGTTKIGRGTRIDNLVMIGHNCQIGEHNLLVGQCGIAGSSSTGQYVVCAGQAGIADHVHLGDFAIIGAKSGVHRDMPGNASYLGMPARPAGELAREQTALKRLPELRNTVREMERQIKDLQTQMQQLLAAMPTTDGPNTIPLRDAA
ncbi:MAG: UDP-3-O-(3-hydroxymyristoyl)glucosamine N-acyltransferase [Planctomycetaceae bacterium]